MRAMATPVEERKQPADRAVARLPEHEFDAIVVVSFGGPGRAGRRACRSSRT